MIFKRTIIKVQSAVTRIDRTTAQVFAYGATSWPSWPFIFTINNNYHMRPIAIVARYKWQIQHYCMHKRITKSEYQKHFVHIRRKEDAYGRLFSRAIYLDDWYEIHDADDIKAELDTRIDTKE
jgi:hypothetical protein